MSQTYTFASWNVNGLRAVLKKDPSFIQIVELRPAQGLLGHRGL